jgi:hypothetical protein
MIFSEGEQEPQPPSSPPDKPEPDKPAPGESRRAKLTVVK